MRNGNVYSPDASPGDIFSTIDRDSDGVVSLTEFVAAWPHLRDGLQKGSEDKASYRNVQTLDVNITPGSSSLSPAVLIETAAESPSDITSSRAENDAMACLQDDIATLSAEELNTAALDINAGSSSEARSPKPTTQEYFAFQLPKHDTRFVLILDSDNVVRACNEGAVNCFEMLEKSNLIGKKIDDLLVEDPASRRVSFEYIDRIREGEVITQCPLRWKRPSGTHFEVTSAMKTASIAAGAIDISGAYDHDDSWAA